jgi:methylmalonyl-CoA mutase N-terminal domain/subunit
MKERFGAKKKETCALRFHASQGAIGMNLKRALPETNIARLTLSGFAGVLAGGQTVGTRTMDEAFGIPSTKANLISVRALQIIAEETGVTNTVDPLAGSYFVEWLTGEVEKRIQQYLDKIDEMGGMVNAIKQGYVQREIGKSAYEYEIDIEEKRKITVGMNLYADPEEEYEEHVYYAIDSSMQREQMSKLRALKSKRDNQAIKMSLDKIREFARKEERNENNLMVPIIEAIKNHATVGEIFGVLREMFGEYQPVNVI